MKFFNPTGGSILQAKLTRLSIQIGYAGIFVSLATFLALLVRFLVIESHYLSDYKYVTQQIIDFVITSISILVLAIPEGLPLAVTISLAYAVKVNKYLIIFINKHII